MKIFLAEDDPSIQIIAKVALSRTDNNQVSVFNHGQDILDALTAAPANELPDLILLDVMMPTLNGFDACIKMKNTESLKHIPIIFLTAKAQVNEVQHGMSLGAIGYILKPFDPMTLNQQIQEVLKNHGAISHGAA